MEDEKAAKGLTDEENESKAENEGKAETDSSETEGLGDSDGREDSVGDDHADSGIDGENNEFGDGDSIGNNNSLEFIIPQTYQNEVRREPVLSPGEAFLLGVTVTEQFGGFYETSYNSFYDDL